jgi:hypothetical protein
VHRHTGEVSVVDEGEGAFGYVRLAKPRTGYESGAQEASCMLRHTIDVRCR